MSQSVTKIFINRSRIYRCIRINLIAHLKIICLQTHLNPFQHFLYHFCIAIYRNSLITIIKIIIVIGKPQRKPFNNKRRKLSTLPAPLLLGIPLDQLFIYIGSHQTDCLLLQIGRFFDSRLPDLTFYDLLRLCRRLNPPHFAEGIHIKWKIIKLIPINCHRRIDILVELCITIHILPNLFIRCMKNVSTITMYINPVYLFCINISCDMFPFVDHKALSPHICHFSGKYSTKQTCPNYQIIILHFILPSATLYSSALNYRCKVLRLFPKK